jgi:outer membrane protein OmpA-like peptidoglycan-associated protein
MKGHGLFRRKALMALGVGVCLIFAAIVTWVCASLTSRESSPAHAAANVSHKLPSRLVLHSVRFDSKTGQLDEGSKAVLDDAAELFKAKPDVFVIVIVAEHSNEDPNGAYGLSATQVQTVASYIERRGIPIGRLMLCQTTRSRCTAEQR